MRQHTRFLFRWLLWNCSIGGLMGASLPALGADSPDGEHLYRLRCVTCHGVQGEGTAEHYPRMLAGDQAIPQLAQFIARSMPPEERGSLTAEEAERVATFIHGAFYSSAAQLKRQLPRIEASRLTGRQYRQTIADLMVSFYGTRPVELKRVCEGTMRRSM